MVEAEERSCALTEYTFPVLSSFTLMLEEPKEPTTQCKSHLLLHVCSSSLSVKDNARVIMNWKKQSQVISVGDVTSTKD